jgi:hypothetical protein
LTRLRALSVKLNGHSRAIARKRESRVSDAAVALDLRFRAVTVRHQKGLAAGLRR